PLSVLSSWGVASRRGHSASVVPPVDYVTLNRSAVKAGVVTAKEQSQYRAQRLPRVQPITRQQQSDQPTTAQGRRVLVPDVSFGLVNRPDSPLGLLLAHEYSQRWIQEQLKRDEMENRRLSDARVKLRTITDTRTSVLRKTHSLPTETPQNQILPRTSRYSQVGPALDTFRDAQSRTRALKALEREAPSRRGQGHGVYNLD
uniref:Cilia- and flagella-associated protein 77 n=1 Tax=Neogobius melanostomus TaxID=47308 RepID=A0A8C6TDL0_9GOBI